jgi:hypothetical protein
VLCLLEVALAEEVGGVAHLDVERADQHLHALVAHQCSSGRRGFRRARFTCYMCVRVVRPNVVRTVRLERRKTPPTAGVRGRVASGAAARNEPTKGVTAT